LVLGGGLGGSDAIDGFNGAFAGTGYPWRLRGLSWSPSDSSSLLEATKDVRHHREKGAQLARTVLEYRAAYPGLTICLAGYSAGCAVILSAAEFLPPGSVDRIILLAPAVSALHDVRPALLCSRLGVDAFCSAADSVFACFGSVFAATDSSEIEYAGLIGFRFRVQPGEEWLYRKLRQHFWHPSMEWTGHTGGHFGCTKPQFLHTYVLPLLLEASLSPPTRTQPGERPAAWR